MKVKHIGGGGSLSIAGVEYNADENGHIEIPDTAAEIAASFGYHPVPVRSEATAAKTELTPLDAMKMSRAELMDYADKKGWDITQVSIAELRRMVAEDVDKEEPPEEPKAEDDESKAGEGAEEEKKDGDDKAASKPAKPKK